MNKNLEKELLKHDFIEEKVYVRMAMYGNLDRTLTILYTDGTWEEITLVIGNSYHYPYKRINGEIIEIKHYIALTKLPRFLCDKYMCYKMTKEEFLDYIDTKILEWNKFEDA